MPLAEAAEGGGGSSSSSSSVGRRYGLAGRSHPNRRLLWVALLATIPVLAVQGVIAWLGLIIKPGGFHPEDRPRSVLGYFFASFWRGDVQQCGGDAG